MKPRFLEIRDRTLDGTGRKCGCLADADPVFRIIGPDASMKIVEMLQDGGRIKPGFQIGSQEGGHEAKWIQSQEPGILVKHLHLPGLERKAEAIKCQADPASERGALTQK